MLSKNQRCFRFFTFNLNINVAPESRYDISGLCSFENLIPKYTLRGQPPSSPNLTAFNLMCDKMED